LVKFSPRPIIVENRVNVVTDFYCMFNKIIGVLLVNVLIKGVYRRTVFTTDKLKLLIQRSFTPGHLRTSLKSRQHYK